MTKISDIPHRIVNAGDIANGIDINVYEYGTSTRVQLYSDDDLTTQVANPYAVTAGNPVPTLYHDYAGEVRVEVVDAGGTVFDDDPYDHPVGAIELASTESGGGAGSVGFDDAQAYGAGTVGLRLNILSATRRPAMDGIFSSSSDQRAQLVAFIADAATNGKTIEWGPIDLSYDVVTVNGSARGLGIPSGSRWVMHPDTRFKAIPNASDSYTLLHLWNASDVVIEGCGARMIGDRDEHTGVGGEFGMGVRIQGSSDITIRDLHIEDCWGDGWYVGSTSEQNHCRNVHLEKISSSRARRNGLSLISARGFRCIDGRFIDTNGTLPEYGIDIEPNFPTDFLEDIEFVRPFTENCAGFGIGIFLNAMEGASNPVGIRLIGHTDYGSNSAFAPSRAVNIPGLIEYIDAKSVNAVGPGILSRGKGASGPRYKIVRPTIIDWNRQSSGSSVFSAGILVYASSGDSGNYALGNIDIIEPDLKLNSGSAVSAIACVDQRTTTPDPMRDIQIVDPLDLAGLLCTASGVKRLHDPLRKSIRTLGNANESIGLAQAAAHYVTDTLTTARTYTITNTQPVGRELTFEIGGADGNQARFLFPSGAGLFPDTLGGSLYVFSSTKGSRLKIRKASATEWTVMEKIGTWATA
ncbi:right-handed parallel beta-helix repeat-containing protein [Sphingopyxis fribergensis]